MHRCIESQIDMMIIKHWQGKEDWWSMSMTPHRSRSGNANTWQPPRTLPTRQRVPPHLPARIGICIYVSHNFDSSSSYSYVYVRVDVGLTLTCRQIQWTTHFQTMHIEKEKGNGNLIKIHHCRFWYRHNKTTHGETGIGYWVGVRVRERMDERRRGKGGQLE